LLSTVNVSTAEFEAQLEKLQVMVEQQNKEIDYLKEIIELMKSKFA